MLYTLAGVPRAAFEQFPMPRNTAIFAPTFRARASCARRLTADARYGRSAPYHGMPAGHLPVRSYLAVPVSRRRRGARRALLRPPSPACSSTRTSAWSPASPPSRRSRSRTRACTTERTRTAQTLQRALLPPQLPEIEGLELAAALPRRGRGHGRRRLLRRLREAAAAGRSSSATSAARAPQAAAMTALARHTLRAPPSPALRPSTNSRGSTTRCSASRRPLRHAPFAWVELEPSGRASQAHDRRPPAPDPCARRRSPRPLGDVGTPLGVIERPSCRGHGHARARGLLVFTPTA